MDIYESFNKRLKHLLAANLLRILVFLWYVLPSVYKLVILEIDVWEKKSPHSALP